MIQTKTKLALAAFLTIGINTATYADGHSAAEKAAAEAAQEAEAAAWLEAKRVSQEAGEGEPTDEA